MLGGTVDPSAVEWIKLANAVGFPVWVSIFLLVRLDNTLRDQTKAVNTLIQEMRKKRED